MMEDRVLQDYIARMKMGEFDDHLMEAIASLSPEDLQEVAYALREEEQQKSLLRY